MKANNSLLRPGIISAADALLLSCSPARAAHWKPDLEMCRTGEVSKEMHNIHSCSWSWTPFCTFFHMLRKLPLNFYRDQQFEFGFLLSLVILFGLVQTSVCSFNVWNNTVCVVFAGAFLVVMCNNSEIFLEPDFKAVKSIWQVAPRWFLCKPSQQFHSGPTSCRKYHVQEQAVISWDVFTQSSC